MRGDEYDIRDRRKHIQAATAAEGGGFARLAYNPAPSPRLAVLVLHDGDAGTWHGAGIAAVEPGCGQPIGYSTCRARASAHGPDQPIRDHAFVTGKRRVWIDPHPGERWTARSSSGGGDIVAGIWLLEPAGPALTVQTSGYDGRRGWTVTAIQPDGAVVVQSLAEYFAAAAPAVELA